MEVSVDDVSCVFRLVREVCELWDDPAAWRAHLVGGACQLLNGHVGMMLADNDGEEGWFGNLAVISSVGMPQQMQPMLQPAISQMDKRSWGDVSDGFMPGMTELAQTIDRQGWVTIAGNQYLDQELYHSSAYYQSFSKLMDCDDFVVSVRIVDVPRRPESISINRPHGAPPFESRDVSLLKLLHDEIAPLIGVRLATEEHLSRDGLSKRLRETLTLLLEGHSEKQVAGALKLGTRTIHDYTMRLYDHFNVSSRAELLAYFVRRTPTPRIRP
jgi:DNA-binding CsgD family transcriptional regulator